MLRADPLPDERALAVFEEREPSPVIARTTTGADGRFAIDAPGPGFWELVARDEQRALAASRRLAVIADEELGTWIATRHGEVKIVDFGLAKANSQLERSEPGIIKGKFSYLSPEAAKGLAVDGRTDIFAVGIILWELLAGRRLFQGDDVIATVAATLRCEVPDPRTIAPDVPEAVAAIALRALERDPARRFATGEEMALEIERVARGPRR